MIKIYDALNLCKLVCGYCQFGLKELLLCCENFDICGASVLHKELCVPYRCLKVDNLSAVDVESLLGRLPLYQGVVYVNACFKNALAELVGLYVEAVA